ncbi:patatin-like phospholipase family protein [Alicyclobacillus mali (ex Roth et al. 2021)]|uniref:patatin-like phospholipase family protein n=1 Tax=Alicyclobacillus mali (ex Roth et al. 2021) TaxID=1123961 RepID=UPI001E631498|nr:patatin-like phospholipase family protein [Alicyclobacillus mali (ex Roth et al. 2021)]
METKWNLGIALSGGTLKAAAHVGVLSALDKLGIRPDAVAGTSAGSLVGCLYAYGYRAEDLERLARSFPGWRLMDYGFPVVQSLAAIATSRMGIGSRRPPVPPGLLRGQRLREYIERLLANRRPQMPIFVLATDLLSGRPIVFTPQEVRTDMFHQTESMAMAVAGSCALPGLFPPVKHGPYLLVDGAMRHYVPVSVLRQVGCRRILAINLYRLPAEFHPNTLIDVFLRAFDILLRETIDNDLDVPSVLLLEPDLTSVKGQPFERLPAYIRAGQICVERHAEAIAQFIRA